MIDKDRGRPRIFAFVFSKKYDLSLLSMEGRVFDQCRAFDRLVSERVSEEPVCIYLFRQNPVLPPCIWDLPFMSYRLRRYTFPFCVKFRVLPYCKSFFWNWSDHPKTVLCSFHDGVHLKWQSKFDDQDSHPHSSTVLILDQSQFSWDSNFKVLYEK